MTCNEVCTQSPGTWYRVEVEVSSSTESYRIQRVRKLCVECRYVAKSASPCCHEGICCWERCGKFNRCSNASKTTMYSARSGPQSHTTPSAVTSNIIISHDFTYKVYERIITIHWKLPMVSFLKSIQVEAFLMVCQC